MVVHSNPGPSARHHTGLLADGVGTRGGCHRHADCLSGIAQQGLFVTGQGWSEGDGGVAQLVER